MISKECLNCDCYDPDFECLMSPGDRWYACDYYASNLTEEDFVTVEEHDKFAEADK